MIYPCDTTFKIHIQSWPLPRSFSPGWARNVRPKTTIKSLPPPTGTCRGRMDSLVFMIAVEWQIVPRSHLLPRSEVCSHLDPHCIRSQSGVARVEGGRQAGRLTCRSLRTRLVLHPWIRILLVLLSASSALVWYWACQVITCLVAHLCSRTVAVWDLRTRHHLVEQGWCQRSQCGFRVHTSYQLVECVEREIGRSPPRSGHRLLVLRGLTSRRWKLETIPKAGLQTIVISSPWSLMTSKEQHWVSCYIISSVGAPGQSPIGANNVLHRQP